MTVSFRAFAFIFALALVSACTTYRGDSLLKLPGQSNAYDQSNILWMAGRDVSDIINSLEISEEEKAALGDISPKSIIRESEAFKSTRVDNQLVLAGADTNIAFAKNSIIISVGAVHILHSSNNIVVSGSNVDISHDGSVGKGSLIISKGKVKISHAGNSLIYAINGVEISHANNVRAFNTRERNTSWGSINNSLVKLLFHEEKTPKPAVQMGAAR